MRSSLLKYMKKKTLEGICYNAKETKTGNMDELIAKLNKHVKDLDKVTLYTLKMMCYDINQTQSGIKQDIITRLHDAPSMKKKNRAH